MNKENRAIEYEALVAEGQAILIEVKGMIWENEQRLICDESIAYAEDSFTVKADEKNRISKSVLCYNNQHD